MAVTPAAAGSRRWRGGSRDRMIDVAKGLGRYRMPRPERRDALARSEYAVIDHRDLGKRYRMLLSNVKPDSPGMRDIGNQDCGWLAGVPAAP